MSDTKLTMYLLPCLKFCSTMKYLVFTLLLITFNNCNSTNNTIANEKTLQTNTELDGSYVVTSLYGEDISKHKLTIKFDKSTQKISGFSGCNMYYCTYTLTNSSFSIGIPGASKRYCEETMEIESTFFKALSEIRTKNQVSGSVIFDGEKKKAILTIKKPS